MAFAIRPHEDCRYPFANLASNHLVRRPEASHLRYRLSHPCERFDNSQYPLHTERCKPYTSPGHEALTERGAQGRRSPRGLHHETRVISSLCAFPLQGCARDARIARAGRPREPAPPSRFLPSRFRPGRGRTWPEISTRKPQHHDRLAVAIGQGVVSIELSQSVRLNAAQAGRFSDAGASSRRLPRVTSLRNAT